MPVCLQEKKITINTSESFTVSKIFDKEISSKNDRWLVLTPLEGLHDIGHISIFYENAKDKDVLMLFILSPLKTIQKKRKTQANPKNFKICSIYLI